jgi:hypothetical protein
LYRYLGSRDGETAAELRLVAVHLADDRVCFVQRGRAARWPGAHLSFMIPNTDVTVPKTRSQ